MEQIARVQECLPGGEARLRLDRQSACSGDCNQCAGCGAARETLLFTARNPIGARPGELVTVKSGSGPVLLAAAVLYGVPVALFFLGYLFGYLVWDQGPLLGGLGFVLGIVLAVAYDRLVARKQKLIYTITGYPAAVPLETWEKGDNND